jgi:hypothetical protein
MKMAQKEKPWSSSWQVRRKTTDRVTILGIRGGVEKKLDQCVITRKEIRNAMLTPTNDRKGYSATEHFFVSSSSSNQALKLRFLPLKKEEEKNYG